MRGKTTGMRLYVRPFNSILFYSHNYGPLLCSILNFGGALILPIALPIKAKSALNAQKTPAVSIPCL